MLSVQFLVAAAVVLPLSSAFLFPSGGGGGGCGCAPPPPPPCPAPPPCPPIMLPQPCLPQLPMPCLPPLPQPCLPQLPSIPMCGCGGRKKRSAPSAPVSGQSGVSSESLCNNPQIRRIILKNLSDEPLKSKTAIHSELKARLGGEYVVVCAQGAFSFIADAKNFCIDGSPSQTCYVFQTAEAN